MVGVCQSPASCNSTRPAPAATNDCAEPPRSECPDTRPATPAAAAPGEIGGAPIEALHLAAAGAAARQALEYLHHARMLARLVVGALAVPCADRCACHADGNDAGVVREVGGACCRRGWHGLLAVLDGPALPGCPARR